MKLVEGQAYTEAELKAGGLFIQPSMFYPNEVSLVSVQGEVVGEGAISGHSILVLGVTK